jgi:ATP-dependent DNA helicase DinG
MVSVGPRECPGAFRCPSGSRCFAEEARAAAAEADVVVVNTHLYGSHLASGGAVLPPHDIVIFDEAHEVESVMTASLGVELAPGRFRALATLARPLLTGEVGARAIDDLVDVADRLADELAERRGSRVLTWASGPSGPRLADRPGAARPLPPRTPGEDRVDEPAGRALDLQHPTAALAVPSNGREWPAASGRRGEDGTPDGRLADLIELARSRLGAFTSQVRAAEEDEQDEPPARSSGRRARVLSAAGHLVQDLSRIAERTDGDVAWVDGTARAPVLRLSPIDVGPALAASLWGVVTAILTSATIPVLLPSRLGLDGFAVDQLDVGSPFDYRRHALLYVARHLPDPRYATPAVMHEELHALIDAAGGRTLALFTSRRATDEAVNALRGVLPYRLWAQGEHPKARLLAEFAEDESSCLFATLGFWQGVDVPGRALMLVTLDRLPFARPDDPLLQARRERAGDEAFRLVDLPRAATLLAQGAGRLIRTADDRGVVAVLDRRLATAGYRSVLLGALPPMRRSTDRRQVEDFLAHALADLSGDGTAGETPHSTGVTNRGRVEDQ